MLIRHGYSDLVDELTDAAVAMAGEVGVSRLSVRQLAQRITITPQALLNRWENRDRIFGIIVGTVADRWITDLENRWVVQRRWHADETHAGLLALLPSEEELAELPAWLGFLEMARTEAMYAHVAAEVRTRERGLVTASLRDLMLIAVDDQPDIVLVDLVLVDLVLAALDGLRRRLVDLDGPFSLAEARIILASVVNLAVDAPKAA